MSRHGDITLPFGGEDRVFRLGIREWERIQEKCDAGPPELMARMAPLYVAVDRSRAMPEGQKPSLAQMFAAGVAGTWRVRDPKVVLYEGLRGGGMLDIEATRLVEREFGDRMGFEHVVTAFMVMEASLAPPADEPLGEKKGKAAPRKSRRSRAGKSASGDSTATAAP